MQEFLLAGDQLPRTLGSPKRALIRKKAFEFGFTEAKGAEEEVKALSG